MVGEGQGGWTGLNGRGKANRLNWPQSLGKGKDVRQASVVGERQGGYTGLNGRGRARRLDKP